MADKNVKFYKTKDGTIVVCKDEFARQQIEQLQGIWEAIEELPDGQAVSAQVAIHTIEIAALQNGKANINGSYDSMTVGMAKNVEATSEISGTSLYRPTAGNADVADGPAKVRSIKGNSVALNQLVLNGNFESGTSGWKVASGTMAASENVLTYTVVNESESFTLYQENFPDVSEHKYFFAADMNYSAKPTYTGSGFLGIGGYYGIFWNIGDIVVNSWFHVNGIVTSTGAAATKDLRIYFRTKGMSAGSTIKIKNVIAFDLTLMFGAGNEPATPEAFEAWLQANVGLQPYYAYNAGKLLAAKLLGLRTVWLNQWDEEWEVGAYSENGEKITDENDIRSKNYTKVISGASYYCKKGQQGIGVQIFTYDSRKNFVRAFVAHNQVFTLNMNEEYINMCTYGNYGSTYNHDICINLHYTNGRDGEYEPYVAHNYDFDTSKVYGKLNGEGNREQVFPNGLKKAGTAQDILDISKGEATVKCKLANFSQFSVDLWNGVFRTVATDKAITQRNIICSHYANSGVDYDITPDKSITGGRSNTLIFIKDTSYSTAADFVAAMIEKNAHIIYELATPLHYTDLVYRDNGVDTPIDALNILVSNYGTEEQIVESPTNGEPNSCAATLDILYGVNAADFMDAANNGAFVSKASLDALCNTLGSALGGTLTSTWNSAEGHYDFTFTPATRQIENPENNE